MKMLKKRGLFFSIDALIALAIIIPLSIFAFFKAWQMIDQRELNKMIEEILNEEG